MNTSLIIKSFIFTLYIIFSVLITPSVFADEVKIGVYPPLITVQSQPPTDIKTPITIENFSDFPQKIIVSFREINGKKNGLVSLKENSTSFNQVLQNIQLLDAGENVDTFDLAAHQKKRLTLQIAYPEEVAPTEAYFTIIFSTEQRSTNSAPKESSRSWIIGGIGTNVLVSIGRRETPKGTIELFTSPLFVAKSPVAFTATVKNPGTQIVRVKGSVTITNMFGQKVGKVAVPEANILAASSRELGTVQTDEYTRLMWNEPFLFGLYTAQLTLYLNDGYPIQASTRFISMPLQALVSLIIFFFLLLLISQRVRQKLHS